MSVIKDDKYGFIGAGNMGSAMVRALVNSGAIEPQKIFVINKENRQRIEVLANECGVQVAPSLDELIFYCSTLILAVKPNQVSSVLDGVSSMDELRSKLVVSVLAGVTLESLRLRLGESVAVVRAMPNTPAQVGEGVTALASYPGLSSEHKNIVERIFSSMGSFYWVEESKMDAITALSGSGPAYFFKLAEEMIAAAKALGLDEELAEDLGRKTFIGAGCLLKESPMSLSSLVRQVTSPNGTTAAALGVFEDMGLGNIVKTAMNSAASRSKELSRSLPD
jgi:pyrroline-5-carboxylate reductase